MDEILASIRRIIESNEPQGQDSLSEAGSESEGFSGRPANDDSEEVSLTVDDNYFDRGRMPDDIAAVIPVLRAADSDLRPAAQPLSDFRQPPLAAVPQKSLSLADVAARVRAASERTNMVVRDMSQNVQPGTAEAIEPVQPIATAPQTARRADTELDHRVDTRIDPTMSEQSPEEDSYVEETAYAPEPGTLLSSIAGEQVARSFQDLTIALEQAERRSLDEIAEEMLRPMLQEWLDDNLPTLVERLVREEIERVVRGPRR
jgi:cell pole-organizing protein PopZ